MAKNHLEIIREAYDAVGIVYVVRTRISNGVEWAYLFLSNEKLKPQIELADLDYLLRTERFMEFKAGRLASY